jgi:hypothetical protein
MDIHYCLEEEVPKLTEDYVRLAKEKKLNINIIPQFVGLNPSVHSYGNPSAHYKSIIFTQWPKKDISDSK